jgi:hypothetical protein
MANWRTPGVASLTTPSALLVINGSGDALFDPVGLRTCFDKLRAEYQKAGVAENLPRLYNTPHEFDTAMQAEASVWPAK